MWTIRTNWDSGKGRHGEDWTDIGHAETVVRYGEGWMDTFEGTKTVADWNRAW